MPRITRPASIAGALFAVVVIVFVSMAIAAVGPFAPKCGKLQNFTVITEVTAKDTTTPRQLKEGDAFNGDEGVIVTGRLVGAEPDCGVIVMSRDIWPHKNQQVQESAGRPDEIEPAEMWSVESGREPVGESGGFAVASGIIGENFSFRNPPQRFDPRTFERLEVTPVTVTTDVEIEVVLGDATCFEGIANKAPGVEHYAGDYPKGCEPVANLPLKAERQSLD